MPPYLTCRNGGSEAEKLPLTEDRVSLGFTGGRLRTSGDLALPHAILLRRGDGYVLCASRQPGIRINGSPAHQRRLRDGDSIEIRGVSLSFHDPGGLAPVSEPGANGEDWLRAFLCSLLLVLLLVAGVFLGLAGAQGGPGLVGEKKGAGEGAAGFGTTDGGGGGNAEGTGISRGSSEYDAAADGDAGFADAPRPEDSPSPQPEAAPAKRETPEPARTGTRPAPVAPPSNPTISMIDPGLSKPAAGTPRGGGEFGGGSREMGTGDVQVTLVWTTAPDVDLHVIDPSEERIWYENKFSKSGGELDVDDTKFDGPENIYWPPGKAPRGRYRVEVCLYKGESATWKVRVRVDGKEKTFSGVLQGQGTRKIVTQFRR